jgi:hypothetical protein
MKMPEEENIKVLSLLWHSPAPSTFSILYGYQRTGINKEANGNPFPRQKSDLFQDSAAMSGVPPRKHNSRERESPNICCMYMKLPRKLTALVWFFRGGGGQ